MRDAWCRQVPKRARRPVEKTAIGQSPRARRRWHCVPWRRPAAAPPRPSGGSGLRVRQHDRVVPRPCTTKGKSNSLSVAVETKVAMPLRSRSRVGNEAWPATASRTEGPSICMSSTETMPLSTLRLMASWSNGVRPLRKSPLPESGRRSSRRSNCSTLMPVSAPDAALSVAVPLTRACQRHEPMSRNRRD